MSLGLRMLGLRRLMSILAYLTVASMLASTLTAFSISCLNSLDTALGAGLGGFVVYGGGARTVFTSRVPLSLYESLRAYRNVVWCRAVTLTPACVKGETVVVRGVPWEEVKGYEKCVVDGCIPNMTGPWAVVGLKAAERLGLSVGECVDVASSRRPVVMYLEVAAVCRFNDRRDYEVIVPLDVGQRLSGLRETMASVVIVRGLGRRELANLLGQSYTLTVSCNVDLSGWIVVLDSLGTPVSSKPVSGPTTLNFTLPFGLYRVTYQTDGLVASLGSVMLDRDRDVNVEMRLSGEVSLSVSASEEESVKLLDESGVELYGNWTGSCWLFRVKPGVYTLSVGGSTYSLPVFWDMVFDPKGTGAGRYDVLITVSAEGGYGVGEFILIIERDRVTVYSARCVEPSVRISLPEGSYKVWVYAAQRVYSEEFHVPEEEQVLVEIPRMIENPERIPLSVYPKLSILGPYEAPTHTLRAFLGLTTAHLATLSSLFLIMSLLMFSSVQRYLYLTLERELKVLWAVGFTASAMFRNVAPPHLALSLLSSTLGTACSWVLYHTLRMDLRVAFLGYGSPFPTIPTFALTTASMAAVWAFSYIWAVRRAES